MNIIQEKIEKIVYWMVTIILATTMLLALIPNKIETEPYHDTFVFKKTDTFDYILLDDLVYRLPLDHNRRLHSIILCRRRFTIGLFNKREILPECDEKTY